MFYKTGKSWAADFTHNNSPGGIERRYYYVSDIDAKARRLGYSSGDSPDPEGQVSCIAELLIRVGEAVPYRVTPL